jgi:hypothetical protein
MNAAKKSTVKPDYRILKCEQKGMCDPKWITDKQVTSCGVYYLVDVNLHIHICSFTPNLEAWPMIGYAEFATEQAREADEGEVEMEMLNSEQPVDYLDTNAANWPNKPASKYLDIPEQERGESDRDYRLRVAEEFREYLCGNPCGF